MNYLLVNAPDEYFSGRSWFGIRFPMDGRIDGTLPPVDGGGIERSRRLLWELIDAERANGLKSEEIAVLGFSQGCLMTLEAGLRYRDPLAGLVGISGWVHEPERLIAEAPGHARSVPVLMTHGTVDPLLGIEHVRPQAKCVKDAGFDLSWQEFDKEHTVAGRAEVQFIARFLEQSFGRPVARRRGSSGTAAE
jgi:phospholipase/carboxylesterase